MFQQGSSLGGSGNVRQVFRLNQQTQHALFFPAPPPQPQAKGGGGNHQRGPSTSSKNRQRLSRDKATPSSAHVPFTVLDRNTKYFKKDSFWGKYIVVCA